MLAALRAVAARLDRAGIHWHLAGGTGRVLLGGRARPGDIDVEVAASDTGAAAAALGLPVPVVVHGAGWSSSRSLGQVAGVPVDVSGGLTVRGPRGVLHAMDADVLAVLFGSAVVHVVRPGESVARAVVSADATREHRARTQLPADAADALCYAESRIAAAANAAR